MKMESTRFEKFLDYLPLLAYFSFWIQGAFLPSFMTEEPRLVWLGVVTLPALIALILAAMRIRRRNINTSASSSLK